MRGGEIDFTAEVDGEYIYLFTEASYEQPFEIEFLDDDPTFEHNEYFDYVPLKRIGIRPHGGSFTEIPLHETVTLQELHIYGSSRLGIKTPDLPITKRQVGYTYTSNYGNGLYLTILDSRDIALTNPAEGPFFENKKGLKQYELSNHLGNVLVVITDKKVSHEGSSGEVGHYTASLLNVQDYFPGGWMLPGRKYSNSNHYRYKHQGQEADDEIYGEGDAYSYTYRISDSRLNRFWSVDPLAAEYPFYSTYSFSGNRLIDMGELEGLEPKEKGKVEGQIGTEVVHAAGIDMELGLSSSSVEEYVWHTGTCFNGVTTLAGWYTPDSYNLLMLDIANAGTGDQDNQWKNYLGDLTISDFGFAEGTEFTATALNLLGEKAHFMFSKNGFVPIMGSENGGSFMENPGYLAPKMATGALDYVPFVEGALMPAFLPFKVSSPVLRFGLEAVNPLGGMRGGKSFSQYKASRGGTETLAKIPTSTGIQRISTEFHHVFITQSMQKALNLPNWMVHNRANVWKLNTIQHSLIDSHRHNFLRAGFKPEVGWMGKYNWFTKF